LRAGKKRNTGRIWDFSPRNKPLMAWTTLKAVRPATEPGSLGDIDSRLPAGHIYRDRDKVTWAHETTHGINARIRNELRVANGYYCLYGIAFTLKDNPSFLLRDIANRVDKSKKWKTYQLYLVQQQKHWNDTPLYVLDELTAYTNGAIVGSQVGMEERARYSAECALEMYTFSKIALDLCKETSYKYTHDLEQFLMWYLSGPIRQINKKTL
jgi:hypothetical protein